MLNTVTFKQFSRYAIVGIGSNAALYLAYLMVTSAGVQHKIAMTVLYIIGVMGTFLFNHNWSFEHSGLTHVAFVKYITAYFVGYVLNLLLLFIGVDYLNLPHQGVQGVAILIVAASLFLMHKCWVFAEKNQEIA